MTYLQQFADFYAQNHQRNFDAIIEYLKDKPDLMVVSATQTDYLTEITVCHAGKSTSLFSNFLHFTSNGPYFPKCNNLSCPYEEDITGNYDVITYEYDEECSMPVPRTTYPHSLLLPIRSHDDSFLGYEIVVRL